MASSCLSLETKGAEIVDNPFTPHLFLNKAFCKNILLPIVANIIAKKINMIRLAFSKSRKVGHF